MLHSVETTQIMDPTKKLNCGCCPLRYGCTYYYTICSLENYGAHFGAKLLCTLLKADRICTDIFEKCRQNGVPLPKTTAQETFELFLPALNNALKAFYKYEVEYCQGWTEEAVFKILADVLSKWECLQNFDFMFSQDVEETTKQLLKK